MFVRSAPFTLRVRLLALGVVLAACPRPEAEPGSAAKAEPAASPSVTPPAPAEEPPRIDAEALAMVEHFGRARALREAVIAGELEDLRAPATWLSEQINAATFPARWRGHVEALQGAARRLVAVETMDAAGAEVAAIAGACGACHEDLKSGPRLTIPPLPEHVPGTGAHMARHQWAAERMWEGLVIPSDEAWRQGAAALAEAPLAAESVSENVELPEEALAMRERVHGLGARGQSVGERAERVKIYGEFVAACATCHKGGC